MKELLAGSISLTELLEPYQTEQSIQRLRQEIEDRSAITVEQVSAFSQQLVAMLGSAPDSVDGSRWAQADMVLREMSRQMTVEPKMKLQRLEIKRLHREVGRSNRMSRMGVWA